MKGKLYKVMTEAEASELMMLWGALHDLAEGSMYLMDSKDKKRKHREDQLRQIDAKFVRLLLPNEIITGNATEGTQGGT